MVERDEQKITVDSPESIELAELRMQLEEAKAIIEAIREGSIDALVLNKDGKPNIYSIESADYTYRVLIEKFSQGAVNISPSGLILYCNEYFATLIGTTADKIIGTYFHSFVDSVGKFQDLKQGSRHGTSKGDIVLNIQGRKMDVNISVTDLHPMVPAIAIIVNDLTEKKNHEKQLGIYQQELESKIRELNETNAMMVQFIHVISHDIKEPLRKIATYAEYIKAIKTEIFDQPELAHLNVITSSAARLNTLVDDLSGYTLNTARAELTVVDLNEIIEQVISDMEIRISEMGIIINLESLPTIRATVFQMRQLFLNLFNHTVGLHLTDQPLTITLSSEICDCVVANNPNSRYHKITLHSDGRFIDSEQLNRTLGESENDFHGNENSVGLAICKKIMLNHGGKILTESSMYGGTKFHLYFPLK